jgi:hypothetical protein
VQRPPHPIRVGDSRLHARINSRMAVAFSSRCGSEPFAPWKFISSARGRRAQSAALNFFGPGFAPMHVLVSGSVVTDRGFGIVTAAECPAVFATFAAVGWMGSALQCTQGQPNRDFSGLTVLPYAASGGVGPSPLAFLSDPSFRGRGTAASVSSSRTAATSARARMRASASSTSARVTPRAPGRNDPDLASG